jgi:hypothetical protein
MTTYNRHLEPCEFYFQGNSSGFADTTDIDVVLDNGKQFPAHSHFLSAFSDELCGAIKHIKGLENAEGRSYLKLANCDTRDALNFLESVYSRQRRIKSVDCAVSLTKVADNYHDGQLRRECDHYLSACAASTSSILYPKVHSITYTLRLWTSSSLHLRDQDFAC